MESKRFKLNKEDGKKIAVGASIAVTGALLTYFAETIPDIDFGQWTPVVVALFSVLVNFGRKFLQEKK